jgi:uncharacterized membrane protein YeaQ/YmgE (transglycosylase-associated protein family)
LIEVGQFHWELISKVYGTRSADIHFLWLIIIGFIAGIVAKAVHPSPNEPSGFVLTTVLGIGGAVLATYLGELVGLYRADEGAGLIGAVVGSIIVLVIWAPIAPGRDVAPAQDPNQIT